MSIEDDVKRVLTCTDDVRCTHEDSCYRMAKFIEQVLEERKAAHLSCSDEITLTRPESLGAEFEVVLNENLWSLYEGY
jgi:hypothetical protein